MTSRRETSAPTGPRDGYNSSKCRNGALNLAEIESRFQSEWVLVEDPQTDEDLRVVSGTVRWHSADRDAVYRKAVQRMRSIGIERTELAVLAHTLPPSATVDGLLGLDFLRGRRLTLDFREGRLSVV